MFGSSRETLQDVPEWSGCFRRFAGEVGRLSRMSGSGRDALPTFESGQEVLRNVLEWSESHPDVREWSGGPPECLGVVGRPSRMSGSGR